MCFFIRGYTVVDFRSWSQLHSAHSSECHFSIRFGECPQLQHLNHFCKSANQSQQQAQVASPTCMTGTVGCCQLLLIRLPIPRFTVAARVYHQEALLTITHFMHISDMLTSLFECCPLWAQVPLPCIQVPITPNRKGTAGGQKSTTIADHVPSTAPMVPSIVVHCLQEVEQRGLSEVGLYRVSGSEREVREIREHFQRGKGVPDLVSQQSGIPLALPFLQVLGSLTKQSLFFPKHFRNVCGRI